MPAEAESPLTDLQLAVMRALWERGGATVAEIHADLFAARRLAITTVATVIARLEKRGLVTHRDERRPFIYVPRASEREVKRAMLAEFTDRLFGGDATELVAHLLTEREISGGDLERVTDLIKAAKRTTRSKGKR